LAAFQRTTALAPALQSARVVMSTQTTSRVAIRYDERGVVYVEQLLMVVTGLCMAAALTLAATHLLPTRFQRMSAVLDSSAP
jgi:hypothetical protein